MSGTIVPHRQLSRDALDGVIEEFVTRDGTETTDAGTKAATVRRALESGELVVVYDLEAQTCNIVPAEEAECAAEEASGDED